MKIGIAKEIQVDERRVALIPDVVARLVKQGVEVWVETGAGERACFSDATYEQVGAKIVDQGTLWGEVDVLLKVGVLEDSEVSQVWRGFNYLFKPLGKPRISPETGGAERDRL